MPLDVFAKEISQEYELVNPEGVVNLKEMGINPHPASLEGKLVVLRANGKHNSENALNRIAELLQGEVKNIKLIRAWEAVPETNAISQTMERSKLWAEKIAAFGPDLVIASSAD
jgi:hypothetical protein